MESSLTRQSKRRRWWLIPISIILLFFLLISAVWVFRRPIATAVVQKVNAGIPGTITIEDGSLTWRRFFTRLSLSLENTVLTDRNGNEVIGVSTTSVIVNPLALLRKNINIYSLELSGVNAVFSIDDEKRLNLYQALNIRPDKDDEETDSGMRPARKKEPSEQIWRKWNAAISDVTLRDINAALIQPDGQVSAGLEYLDLHFLREKADGIVDLSLALSDIKSEGQAPGYFRGKRYTLDLEIHTEDGIAEIRTGELGVQGALLALDGTLALYQPFDARLGLSAQGTDTNLLLTFLPPGVSLGDVEPVGNGKIDIEGSLIGPLAGKPDISLSLSCDGFGLRHKTTGLVMDDINFNAGVVVADGSAVFEVKSLGAQLPDGFFKGRMSLENLKQPAIELEFDAGLELETLASFFTFSGSETIRGRLDLDVDVAGKLDGHGSLVSKERESGNIHMSGFRYLIQEGGTGIRNLDLVLQLADGIVEVKSLESLTDIGNLKLSGSFGNFWPLVLGGDGPLNFSLSMSSPSFNLAPLFHDPEVAATWDIPMRNLQMVFSFDTTVDNLWDRSPIPSGVFRIDNLQADFPDHGKYLSRFNGEVKIDSSLTASLGGELNDSEVDLTLEVQGYEGLLNRDITIPVKSRFVLYAPTLMVSDIISSHSADTTFWTGRGLNNLNADLELVFNNSEWFASRGRWPDGQWILHNLSGATTLTETPYSFSFNMQAEEGTAELTLLSGRIGGSNFAATGGLDNTVGFFDKDAAELTAHLNLKSSQWDMREILSILQSSSGESDDTEDDQVPVVLALSDRKFPELHLDVAIDNFYLEPAHWTNLGGTVALSHDGILNFNDLGLDGPHGGSARVKGKIDISQSNSIRLDADVRIADFNLGAAIIPMTVGEESFSFGDVVKGVLTGDISLVAKINPDLSINLDDSSMDVKARLVGGRLISFPPFTVIADKFKNRNMNDVRLDNLNFRISLEDSVLTIPKTSVGSTLGYLELEGYSQLNGYMSYGVTVPNSVIDDLLSGFVLGVGSSGSDEIINAENSGRNRTTINVVGESEDLLVNFGKQGRSRLEDRWKKRQDRQDRRNSES